MASKLPTLAAKLTTRIWNDLEPNVGVNLNFSQVPHALLHIFIALLFIGLLLFYMSYTGVDPRLIFWCG